MPFATTDTVETLVVVVTAAVVVVVTAAVVVVAAATVFVVVAVVVVDDDVVACRGSKSLSVVVDNRMDNLFSPSKNGNSVSSEIWVQSQKEISHLC